MGQFKFTKCDIEGMFLVEPAVFGDNRGYFMETYHENDFKEAGYDLTFVQDNQSKSTKGVLRGLHLQLKYPQGKLVRVIKGKVFENCKKLSNVTFVENSYLTIIENYAFKNCCNLKELLFENNTCEIISLGISLTQLKSFKLPLFKGYYLGKDNIIDKLSRL